MDSWGGAGIEDLKYKNGEFGKISIRPQQKSFFRCQDWGPRDWMKGTWPANVKKRGNVRFGKEERANSTFG